MYILIITACMIIIFQSSTQMIINNLKRYQLTEEYTKILY